MSLSKKLAEALADTVAKQHPAFRDSTNWQPYYGPRGGEGYINVYTGDVTYRDDRPGMAGWGDDGEVEVDESFRAAPDGYQWERPPMNHNVKDEIDEADPENIDGFLEAKFSGDQVIYEEGRGDDAAHSWGRVTGARVDTYTNLGGHEVKGVVLELEAGGEVPLDGVEKYVNTSKDPKYEVWQLVDEDPHESDLEDVSEKVYHSFSHDEFEWKQYADARGQSPAFPVLSERGSDDLWAAMSAYFDNETMDEFRADLAGWKSDSDRGTGRYSDFAKEVFDIQAESREGEWESSTPKEDDYKRALEIMADVSRRFYEDQYEGEGLYRGISRHGFRSLVKGWLENPGADEYEVEHRALANYSADHRVAGHWAGNTAIIAPEIDPQDIVLAIDGLNFSGVHNTESEVHIRGDSVTVRPDDVVLSTWHSGDGNQSDWKQRKAGLNVPVSEFDGSDARNFSRAISLIYDDETPDEEAARRFLNIAKVHEQYIEDRVEHSHVGNFEREDFFETDTAGLGEAHGDVIKWENEYLDLLARIKEQYGLTLDSVEKGENPPGTPDETPVIDLTEDWFLNEDAREARINAVSKQETEAGTWVPYLGPNGGEGWQNVNDRDDIRYGLDEPPGQVADGYDRDHWDTASDRVSDFKNRLEEKVSQHDAFHRQHYAIKNELDEEIDSLFTFIHGLPKFRDNIDLTKDLATSIVQADEHGLLDGDLGINNTIPSDAHGEYWFSKNSLSFNNNFDKETLEGYYESGEMVGNDIEWLVLHELGHHRHQMKMEESERSLSEFSDNIISHKGEWNQDFFIKVDEQVSSYARHEPTEFVAEVFSGLCLGIDYDDEIMERYKEYGGPDDWKQYRKNVHPDGPKVPRKDNRDIEKSLPKPFVDEADTVWESFIEYVNSKEQEGVEKQETDAGKWIPYLGPDGGEGWQNTEDPDDVRYQIPPPGEVAEGVQSNFWEQDFSEYNVPLEPVPGLESLEEGDVVLFEYRGNATRAEVQNKTHWAVTLDIAGRGPKTVKFADEEMQDNLVGRVLDAGIEGNYDWDTDVPRIDELQEGADILYEDANGEKQVGTFEEPAFVSVEGDDVDDGTYPGMRLANGDEIRLQDIDAVDEGLVPLEPRDDPYEFDSVVREEDLHEMDPWTRENVELWGPVLEFTPFDHLGEVPLGAKVEFHDRKVNGSVTGEVIGYIDYDADIGETNVLRVQSDDEYVGETAVRPTNFVQFIGPETEQDLSMEEYLENPFQHARAVKDPPEVGITDGNTTGQRMKILEMPNDERIFATPLDAYNNIVTGVVDGPDEAKRNNLNSPIMINHLGGNGCQTELVEDQDGETYIAKEGIEGRQLRSASHKIDHDDDAELIDSLEQTFAAAFFVGNLDLHGANVMVNFHTQEATIIDHDRAGGASFGNDWMDISRLARGPASKQGVRERINDIARDYLEDRLEIPEELENTRHEDHFRNAFLDRVQDEHNQLLWSEYDTTIHEPVDGFESTHYFAEGMEIKIYHPDTMRVKTATLTDMTNEIDGSPPKWYGETDDGYEVSFRDSDRVLEITDYAGHNPNTVPIEPTEESEAFMDALTDDEREVDSLTEFEPGERITIDQGLDEERVIVEDVDDSGAITQMLVRPADGGDPFHVNTVDDIVTVHEETPSRDALGADDVSQILDELEEEGFDPDEEMVQDIVGAIEEASEIGDSQ